MEAAIKDLGLTFIVGAFVVLGFEFVAYYVLGRSLTGFFEGKLGFGTRSSGQPVAPASGTIAASDANKESQAISVTLFVTLAFGLGLIAEDVSGKFMDSGEIPLLGSIPHFPSKTTLRVSVLVEDTTKKFRVSPHWQNIAGSPLGRDLARSKAFSRISHDSILGVASDASTAQRVQTFLVGGCTLNTPACADSSALESEATRLYYLAKNTVYRFDSYYDELKRIQTRVDFSRSIAIISAVYAAVAILFGAFALIERAVRLPAVRSRERQNEPNGRPEQPSATVAAAPTIEITPSTLRRPRRIVAQCSGVVALLTVMFVATGWAFVHESLEFNKRAFGYFSSALLTRYTVDVHSPPRGDGKEQQPLTPLSPSPSVPKQTLPNRSSRP